MCSEADWTLEAAVAHLRSITALACGNPYLILERVFGKKFFEDFFSFWNSQKSSLSEKYESSWWILIANPLSFNHSKRKEVSFIQILSRVNTLFSIINLIQSFIVLASSFGAISLSGSMLSPSSWRLRLSGKVGYRSTRLWWLPFTWDTMLYLAPL